MRKKEKVKDLKRVLREFLGLFVLSFSRQSAFSIYNFISIKYALFTNYDPVSEVSSNYETVLVNYQRAPMQLKNCKLIPV